MSPEKESGMPLEEQEAQREDSWAEILSKAREELEGLSEEEKTEKLIEVMAQNNAFGEKIHHGDPSKIDLKEAENTGERMKVLLVVIGDLLDEEVMKRIEERKQEILEGEK